jgi:4-hydroxy-tetrahydrodipicolinate synthase
MLALGACGLMNAVGNIAPRRVSDLYEHTAAGRMAEARAAHYDLFELNSAIFFDTNPIPLKYMMKRMGLLSEDEHRLPMLPADAQLADRLDGVLRRARLL